MEGFQREQKVRRTGNRGRSLASSERPGGLWERVMTTCVCCLVHSSWGDQVWWRAFSCSLTGPVALSAGGTGRLAPAMAAGGRDARHFQAAGSKSWCRP